MAWIKRIFIFSLMQILILFTINLSLQILAPLFGLDPNGYWLSITSFAVALGFGGAFINLALSRHFAKKLLGVKLIESKTASQRDRWILETVHNLARKAKLPALPEVGIYPSPEVNAFATGPSKRRSLVAVSEGILSAMNEDELEGVLGHEVAHIANGDMVTMTLLQGVLNSLVLILANVLARVISNAVDEKMRFIVFMGTYFGLQILLSILAIPIMAYFSRSREYRADAGGAKLAGVTKMIQALQALSHQTARIDTTHESLNSFKISGKRKPSWMLWFSTHPPLEDRISKLQRRGGY